MNTEASDENGGATKAPRILVPNFETFDEVEAFFDDGHDVELPAQARASPRVIQVPLPSLRAMARPLAWMWRGSSDVGRVTLGFFLSTTLVTLLPGSWEKGLVAIAAMLLFGLYALRVAGNKYERRARDAPTEARQDPTGGGRSASGQRPAGGPSGENRG